MPRILRFLLALLIAGVIVGGPILYHVVREARSRNFRVVKEGVLYRSGQLTLDGLKRVIHDHGIRTIITLRPASQADEGTPDAGEEAYCVKEGLNYVRIPPRPWWASDGSVPAE